jgi:hypothetical protein
MRALLSLLALVAGLQSVAQQPPGGSLRPGDDPVLLEEVGRIGGRVELVRSQRFVRPPFAVRVPDEVRNAAVQIRVYGLISRERLAARGRAWADLGLGSAEAPRNLLVALAADLEGMGFDPSGNRLLIAPSRLSTEDFEPTEGEDDPATLLMLTGMRPDAPIVAHLLTHVRQHERAGRELFEPTTDGLLAAAAWSEGEANLVAVRYLFAGLQVEEAVMQFVDGPELLLDGALLAPGVGGLPGLESDLLSFVYHDGYRTAAELHARGGWEALDRAMASRRTTRDLMHPDRPPLAAAEFPAPEPPREDLTLADEDSLGERATVALISLATGKDSLGLMAGDGWAGDRLYRWEAAGREQDGLTEWVTRWTEAGSGSERSPAADFDYALGRALEARHPGAAFSAVEAGVRTLVAGGKLYRIERRAAEVKLRVQPVLY